MRYYIRLGDRTLVADLEPRSDGALDVSIDGHTARVEVQGADVWVEGQRVPLTWDRARQSARVAGRSLSGAVSREPHENAPARADASSRELRAPMPGKVVALSVTPGQDVAAGQSVLVLEAMKMQNEVTAPCPCRVVRVCVREGDAVETAALLCELSPLEAEPRPEGTQGKP